MSNSMLTERYCVGCGARIYRIRPPFERRSIPVNSEPLWIKKDASGSWYILESGASVCGYPVGDAYDDSTDLVIAYEPHLPHCPTNGRAPRKPRNRVKSDIRNGYDFEKREYSSEI